MSDSEDEPPEYLPLPDQNDFVREGSIATATTVEDTSIVPLFTRYPAPREDPPVVDTGDTFSVEDFAGSSNGNSAADDASAADEAVSIDTFPVPYRALLLLSCAWVIRRDLNDVRVPSAVQRHLVNWSEEEQVEAVETAEATVDKLRERPGMSSPRALRLESIRFVHLAIRGPITESGVPDAEPVSVGSTNVETLEALVVTMEEHDRKMDDEPAVAEVA